MAERQVIWSNDAERELSDILEFFISKNKSTLYSSRLPQLFSDAVKQIAMIPDIGLACENADCRILKE